MPALGERFRAAREARGLSLSDVSEQIRIRSVYLAAIEDENWSAIGAPVYVRGFLRTYARFLGLDPEEVVAAFNGASMTPAPARTGIPEPAAAAASRPASGDYTGQAAAERPRRGGSWMIWVASLVAIALVAFVVYQEITLSNRNAPPPQVGTAPSTLPSSSAASPSGAPEESTAPSPLASGSAAPQTQGPNTLALVLSEPSWLRVTVDGNVSMEGTFPAGTSKTFHGKNALIRVGNAGGVQIFVDGKDVGKLGKPGDVVERSFTL